MLMGIDPLYWMLMAPVILFSLFASMRVKSAFNKYTKIQNQSGKSGAEVAVQILQRNGLHDVQVVEGKGLLSDHYDPTKKVVKLSAKVYHNRSIAAIGIAAHETGHALQHAQAYTLLTLRNMMVPLASIGSNFAWVIIFAGFIFNALGLVKIGIVLFSAVVVFQLITLPVEFNASARAKIMLKEYGMVSERDSAGVNRVLNAAAMTYVAAAASAIMTLLYFLLRSGILGGDD